MPTHTLPRHPDVVHTNEREALYDLVNQLHTLAPAREHPDQAIEVHVHVPTPAHVRQTANRAATPVKVLVSPSGDAVHTSTRVGYGTGVAPNDTMPEFRYAAILVVEHIAVVTPDDDGQGDDR